LVRYPSNTSLRDYIEHFFGCYECKMNFMSMYDNCQFSGCDRLTESTAMNAFRAWRELPLWLWEVHNDVNVRLMKERKTRGKLADATQEEEQDARWPSKVDCPACWKGDGSWDERSIFKYLQKVYGSTKYEVTQKKEIKNHQREWFVQSDSIKKFRGGISFLFFGSICILWLNLRNRAKRKIGFRKKKDPPNLALFMFCN